METGLINCERAQIKTIRKGDVFVNHKTGVDTWTAVSDASVMADGQIRIGVRYADGILQLRHWSAISADMMITVRRA